MAQEFNLSNREDFETWKSFYIWMHSEEVQSDAKEWQWRGLDLWPIIKCHVLGKMSMSYLLQRPTTKKVTSSLVRRLLGEKNVRNLILKKEFEEPTKLNASHLFFANSSTAYFNEEKFLNRIFSPIQDSFEKSGESTLQLYNDISNKDVKVKSSILPTKSWRSNINEMRVYAAKEKFDLFKELRGFKKWWEDLNQKKPRDLDLDLRGLKIMILVTRALGRYLADEFLRNKVKSCYVSSYYGVPGFAIAWACSECNIDCIEVQHGVQGPWHFAYHWPGLEKKPNSLPSKFLNWNEVDKNNILSWGESIGVSSESSEPCWFALEKWLQQNQNFTPRDDLQNSSTKKVLISLQLREFKKWHQDILRLAKDSGFEIWWRLHPKELEAASHLVEKNKDFERDFNIEKSTRAFLPDLLRSVDLHISNYSSLTLEAYHVGVETLVLSHQGAHFFEGIVPPNNLCLSFEELGNRLNS